MARTGIITTGHQSTVRSLAGNILINGFFDKSEGDGPYGFNGLFFNTTWAFTARKGVLERTDEGFSGEHTARLSADSEAHCTLSQAIAQNNASIIRTRTFTVAIDVCVRKRSSQRNYKSIRGARPYSGYITLGSQRRLLHDHELRVDKWERIIFDVPSVGMVPYLYLQVNACPDAVIDIANAVVLVGRFKNVPLIPPTYLEGDTSFPPTGAVFSYVHVQPEDDNPWDIYHGMDAEQALVQLWDDSNLVFLPGVIRAMNDQHIQIQLGEPESGRAVLLAAQEFGEYYIYNNSAGSTLWNIGSHGIGSIDVLVEVWSDEGNEVIIPNEIEIIGTNQIYVRFSEPVAGRAVVIKGESFEPDTASTSWVINHDMNTYDIVVHVYDENDKRIIPDYILAVSQNTIQVGFREDQDGRVVIARHQEI